MVFKAHLFPGLIGRDAQRRLAGGGPLTKTLRIMKLSAFFLFAAALHVTAAGYGQKITLSEKDASLQDVFQKIEKQTGYLFLYRDEWLREAKKVSFSVTDGDLDQVLSLCFRNQPFTYSILDKSIVVRQREPAPRPTEPFSPNLPPNDIHGRVTDSLGNPLVGASVTVKGTKMGTQTDGKGEFDLKGVDSRATLIISFTGFEAQQIRLDGRMTVALVLKHNDNPLDQVQVIAYGTTSPRYSTGDVTTVTAKEIEKQPVDNVLLALEGRVPGLFITQATGLPGTGVSVLIQGQNSIASGNDPFYVVDGVPYTSQLLPNLGSILGTGNTSLNGGGSNGNPLSFINPSDIESISVLKDADATAIYGSRAANGAIIITTKKGQAGQTKVDLNLQQGMGDLTRRLNLMNTSQYLQMRNEALNNDGIAPSLANGDYDLLMWDTTRNTDWQKTLIGNTAQYTNLTGAVSGGTNSTQYLVGATYRKQTTVFPGNFSDQTGGAHFSITSSSENKKFQTSLSGNYVLVNNQLPNLDLTQVATQLAPNAPPLYNNDGTINWAPDATGSSSWPFSSNSVNPVTYLYQKYSNKTKNLVSNAIFSYQLFRGLEIKASLGYTDMQTAETVVVPLTTVAPQNQPYTPRIGEYGASNLNSWIAEPQMSYRKQIDKGKFSAIIGSTIEQNNSIVQQYTGVGFTSDALIPDPSAAAKITAGQSVISNYKYNALFGRLSYNWDDTYLFNFTARRDGSSRFGPQNQFHNFGAAGVAWIFSNSEFVKKHVRLLSFGKLRASYGTTGNDQIGDYRFLSTYSTTYAGAPYQGVTGLQPNALPNPYLEWENTKKMELGLDLGILKDNVVLNAAFYQNRSSNELLSYSLPITTGFSGITANFPATIQNLGWELSLHTINIKTNHFTWSMSFNLTIPKNKLLSFPNLATSSYASSLIIGKPISIKRVFHSIGVNDSTGMYEFDDAKGDATYNPSYPTDLVALINVDPKFYGGVQSTFQYRGFTLDVLFQFTKQIASNDLYGEAPGSEGYNQPAWDLNRWQKPGDVKPIQRYNSDYSIYSQYAYQISSDASYTDASYIRMKNLSLSWQIPFVWSQKAHIKNARLYLQGQNLLTFTRYLGLDPETRSSITLPPLRILTFGFQIGL